MNWYRKAKLIDKRHPTDKDETTVRCMYCHRWATHPENERVGKENYIWKKHDELDNEEHFVAKNSLLNINVSSSICDKCWGILTEYNSRIPPEKVRELSLK